MQHQGCCPAPEVDFAAQADDLRAELALDPALEDCCRRDLEDQAREAGWKAELVPHDRSQQRQRLARQVFRQAAAPPAGEAAAADDLDGDEDGDLERLRQLRLAELQQLTQAQQRLRSEGHGVLETVSTQRLLELLKQDTGPSLVAHFAYEGDAAGAALDEHLAFWACRYMGTRFVRCMVLPGSRLPSQLNLPPGPALVSFRDGAILGRASLEAFGADDTDVEEEAVLKWLRKSRMLQHSLESGEDAAGAAPLGADADASSQEDEEDAQREPCNLCGRRYTHQHVRSVHAQRDSSSDED